MDPQLIFEKLIEDFVRAGLPLKRAQIYPTLQYSNTVTKLGSCQKRGNMYYISLSRYAMKDENQIRNTLAHELVHTLPRCMNHGKTFHRYGDMVEQALGIEVNSRASEEEAESSGVKDAYMAKAQYKIVCKTCGTESYRLKRSALVENPSHYRCGKCGGKLEVYQRVSS